MLSRHRKKNGGCHPAGGHARSRATVADDLERSPQAGMSGSGGHRDASALSHASGWGNVFDQTAPIPNSGRRPADRPVSLWPLSSLPGTALQAGPDRVGKVEVSRPYYLCSHCHTGQFPADVELDINNMEFSPGVRRMQAVVGQESPFDHGRQQMKLLAGLEVTTKAVERTAEAIGENVAAREQAEIQRAMQLD